MPDTSDEDEAAAAGGPAALQTPAGISLSDQMQFILLKPIRPIRSQHY